MEVKVLNIEYQLPEVIISTSDAKAFRKYLSEGFFVSCRKNGYITLRKRSKVLVKIEYEGTEFIVDLKQVIIDYYVKGQTRKLTKRFKKDLENDKIRLESDSNGYFSIVEK